MEAKWIIPTQQGGNLLAQGAYGCIFTPPLVCRNEKVARGKGKKNLLGKLSDAGDVNNEIAIAEIFKGKPEAAKYFILPELPSLCIPAALGKQAENDMNKCEFIKRPGAKDKLLHYQMPYGGKTLLTALFDEASPIPKTFSFFIFMGQMLEIGAYLALHGVIHNDLHLNNILVNESYVPRLIDFGRSYVSSNITADIVDNLSANYDPSLGQLAPETSAIDGIRLRFPLSMIIDDLKMKKPGIRYSERILGVNRNKETAEFLHFWKSSKAVQQKDWVNFMQLYWSVADSWAIGDVLVDILHKLTLSNQFLQSTEWIQKQNVVKIVLRGMLKASPRVRLDCVEALALYNPMNHVVSSSSGKAWLKQKEYQRSKIRAS